MRKSVRTLSALLFTLSSILCFAQFTTTKDLLIETWESGDFSAFPWILSGDANWFVQNSEVYEGAWAVQSGAISDYQQTELSMLIYLLSDDQVSFMHKVSTEENYDKLHFYIDNTEPGNWSGSSDWEQASFPISAGMHTLKWTYTKDYSNGYLDDCVWLDNIILPNINTDPQLIITQILLSDTQGNNNNIFEPGELININVELLNEGLSTASNIEGNISCNNALITVIEGNTTLSELAAQDTWNTQFTFKVNESAPPFALVNANISFNAENTNTDSDFSILLGTMNLIENFETGDFETFEWENYGDAPWNITSNNPGAGIFSAKSGQINDYGESILKLTLDVIKQDSISFLHKISSEESYDKLLFYIDNELIDSWSGQSSWENNSYAISSGLHTFIWKYKKDVSNAYLDDCAWLDDIKLPPAITDSPLNLITVTTADTLCQGESVQLTAIVSGGTGMYEYSWTPQTGLSNPLIYNPTASPETSITYTCIIQDGLNELSQEIPLTVFEAPLPPLITQNGLLLISNSATNNQWFLNDEMIPGANAQVYLPQQSGIYHACLVNNNFCYSTASNTINYNVASTEDLINDLKIYPNPAQSHFTIAFSNTSNHYQLISIYNAHGQIIYTKNQPKIYSSHTISCNNWLPGSYTIKIVSKTSTINKKILIL